MAVSGEKGLARVWRMKSMEKERGWDAGMKNSNRNRRGEQTQHKSEKAEAGWATPDENPAAQVCASLPPSPTHSSLPARGVRSDH